MAEVGDEELNDILPKEQKPQKEEFRDIGYYKDEKGYTRFGIIPKNQNKTIAYWNQYDGKNITSNPRYR